MGRSKGVGGPSTLEEAAGAIRSERPELYQRIVDWQQTDSDLFGAVTDHLQQLFVSVGNGDLLADLLELLVWCWHHSQEPTDASSAPTEEP